jgi:hypothetical protein
VADQCAAQTRIGAVRPGRHKAGSNWREARCQEPCADGSMYSAEHRATAMQRVHSIKARATAKRTRQCAQCAAPLSGSETGMGYWLCIACRVGESA